ncbi:MAG: peptide deformylase [Spirochaetales bacterium]
MELVCYPADVLKRRAVVVSDPRSVEPYLAEMQRILRRNAGVGLAAPQVGIAERFFVSEVRPGRFCAFVNPQIEEHSKRVRVSEESCLSLPDFFLKMQRYSWVEVSFSDETGARRRIKARGLLARIIQHELDHLNGVLLLDHADAKKRERYEQRLIALSSARKEQT